MLFVLRFTPFIPEALQHFRPDQGSTFKGRKTDLGFVESVKPFRKRVVRGSTATPLIRFGEKSRNPIRSTAKSAELAERETKRNLFSSRTFWGGIFHNLRPDLLNLQRRTSLNRFTHNDRGNFPFARRKAERKTDQILESIV